MVSAQEFYFPLQLPLVIRFTLRYIVSLFEYLYAFTYAFVLASLASCTGAKISMISHNSTAPHDNPNAAAGMAESLNAMVRL